MWVSSRRAAVTSLEPLGESEALTSYFFMDRIEGNFVTDGAEFEHRECLLFGRRSGKIQSPGTIQNKHELLKRCTCTVRIKRAKHA